MANLEKIIDSLNIPKQIIEKSEALLKTLFGPSFNEIGGMISDQVRLRRFKNQIKIFSKAQEILKEKKIDPKKVSLKVLAPLIEYSSYEEEETLQEKWSKLVVDVLENNFDISFHQNCITILNRISTEEAHYLDSLYLKYIHKRNETLNKRTPQAALFDEGPVTKTEKDLPINLITFSIGQPFDFPRKKVELIVANLVAMGLLKWETDVDIEGNSSGDPEDTSIEFDITVDNNYYFIFTHLGLKFLEVCTQID